MRTRKFSDRLLRKLQCCHRLLPRYGRKRGQELLERISGLEIIEEVINGHPGTHEHRSTAHDLGIAVHNLLRVHPPILRLPRSRSGGQDHDRGSELRSSQVTAPTRERHTGQFERPGGRSRRPGGRSRRPGGCSRRPGGRSRRPGGRSRRPGGCSRRPGGRSRRPGGRSRYLGGRSWCPGGCSRAERFVAPRPASGERDVRRLPVVTAFSARSAAPLLEAQAPDRVRGRASSAK
jgi:hypothetical protein